jgi:hypothetical protein
VEMDQWDQDYVDMESARTVTYLKGGAALTRIDVRGSLYNRIHERLPVIRMRSEVKGDDV